MKTNIKKWDDGFDVRIPASIFEKISFTEETELNIRISNDTIILEKFSPSRHTQNDISRHSKDGAFQQKESESENSYKKAMSQYLSKLPKNLKKIDSRYPERSSLYEC